MSAPTAGWRVLKWIVKHADDLGPPAYLVLKELLDQEGEADPPGWHRFVCKFERVTAVGTSEDFAQIKFDVMKIGDGGSDNSWAGADFTAVGTAIDAFMNVYAPQMSNTHTYKELRSYRMRFNPSDPGPGGLPLVKPVPFQLTGPPVYIASKGITGSASNIVAYQTAATLTLKTGFPRHWGRVYLPSPGAAITGTARFSSGFMTAVANGAFDLQDDLAAAGFLLCIPMTQMQRQKFHGLLGVSSVVVDDVPDVIRRRRPKQAAVHRVGVE